MLDIVTQTLEFYLKFKKAPNIDELKLEDTSLTTNVGSVFVTLYKNGNIRGAAGNIKEIKASVAEELIENTISALNDSRFDDLKLDELKDIKIRIDAINDRKMLKDGEILKLEPTKSGVLVIEKEYNKMACILPNIDPKLLTGEDFIGVLKAKLAVSNFKEADYIIYEIKTQETTNF